MSRRKRALLRTRQRTRSKQLFSKLISQPVNPCIRTTVVKPFSSTQCTTRVYWFVMIERVWWLRVYITLTLGWLVWPEIGYRIIIVRCLRLIDNYRNKNRISVWNVREWLAWRNKFYCWMREIGWFVYWWPRRVMDWKHEDQRLIAYHSKKTLEHCSFITLV